MKQFRAFLAAFTVTAIIAVAMLSLGANALFSPPTAMAASTENANPSSASVEELQALVAQYQQREQEYRTQLDAARRRIEQDTEQIQQYQSLLQQIQQQGSFPEGQEGFEPRHRH